MKITKIDPGLCLSSNAEEVLEPKTYMLLNPGSSERLIKAHRVTIIPREEDLDVFVEKVEIDISQCMPLPDKSDPDWAEKVAEIIAPSFLDCANSVDEIMCRCPALKYSVDGIIDVDAEFMETFKENLAFPHGSELGVWLAWRLSLATDKTAFFGRGIPTEARKAVARVAGQRGVETRVGSHYESIMGVRQYLDNRAFVLVMLGSAFAVYGVDADGEMTSPSVRQYNCGPMSISSAGGWTDTLTWLEWLESEGVETVKEAKDKLGPIFAKKGGLSSYDPRYASLPEFMKDIRYGISEAVDLYEAVLHQVRSCIGMALYGMGSEQPVIVFAGGGANYPEIIGSIMNERAQCDFSDVVVLDDGSNFDPELNFFINEMIDRAAFY